ncbi:MAG: DUF1116 domain-containing protein [Lentisphaeria bacterium]|nr:DUF1116 domain-containing protein [Lentisphaeria bacterium]
MREANRLAYEKLCSAEPVLTGCRRVGEVVPGFRKNLILHSGPDIEFGRMRGPHRMGVIGAALFEGLAKDEREAEGMIASGEIGLAAANDWNSGAPGAGITSYSMPVLVVREKRSGVVAVAPPIEGVQRGGLGGWGVYNSAVRENLVRMAEYYMPLLNLALEAADGVNVAELFAEGLLMGDEEHTRQAATDKLFIFKLIDPVSRMSASDADKLALLNWLADAPRFVHHIGCASAVASLKSAAGVPGSTLVTAMCGNGVEFGVKVSGRGDSWHTAPAPAFSGYYFSAEHSDADAAPWLGDSGNVEAWGLGGMAAAAAPALLASRGESLEDGLRQCGEMAEICAGVNRRFAIPALGGGAPCGILAELAAEKGVAPKMHGGILSRSTGGQIGIGYARTPLDCFRRALA